MGKYFVACPNCNTMNPTSTSFLSKRRITCVGCNKEIDVKSMRYVSKECANCGNTYVIDQAKTTRCPGCGKPYGNMIKITCPSCSCQIAVKNEDTDNCPICNTVIHVRRELEKAKQVRANSISVIKYEGSNEAFIYKHPIEDFNLGSQLIVHESQEAVFFYNGEALRPFKAGRHTLSTENIPLLRNVIDTAMPGSSPFHAEVYFTNLTDHVGLGWGTPNTITFIEPNYNIPLELRAYGTIGLKVVDSLKLIKKLIGTTDLFNVGNVFDDRNDGTDLPGYFKSPLITEIKSYLPMVINQYGINILNIDSHLKELSAGLMYQIKHLFEKYGLEVTEFNINRISVPEDNPNYKRIRKLATESGLRSEEISLDAKIAEMEANRVLAEGKIAEARAIVEANKKRIESQGIADSRGTEIRGEGFAEADVLQRKGLAEADIMRNKGVTGKDYLDAEVQKAYAEGIGKMGSNMVSSGGGSGGSSIAGDFISMAAGLKMADYALEKMNNTNMFNDGKMSAPTDSWSCSCGKTGNTKNFCGSCGKPRFSSNTWTCSNCGNIGNTDNFCENCGKPKA